MYTAPPAPTSFNFKSTGILLIDHPTSNLYIILQPISFAVRTLYTYTDALRYVCTDKTQVHGNVEEGGSGLYHHRNIIGRK